MPSCFRPAGFNSVSDALRFTYAPRYSVGTPGLIRSRMAKHFSEIEKAVYDDMIKGIYGEAKKAEAMRLGLSGIVEERWTFRGIEMYRDLITGEAGSVLDREVKRQGK